MELEFRKTGAQGVHEKVTDLNPLPVGVTDPVIALGRLVVIPQMEIPGITAADALDASDAFGTVFTLLVPKAGVITKLLFHDLDNEGINKDLWLFSVDPTARAAANDAAFVINDLDNPNVVDVLTFDTWKTGTGGQIGQCSLGLPCWYVAPLGRLWAQFKTAGTDNIAAGSMPRLSGLIERYADN